jgi:hypothetical protein
MLASVSLHLTRHIYAAILGTFSMQYTHWLGLRPGARSLRSIGQQIKPVRVHECHNVINNRRKREITREWVLIQTTILSILLILLLVLVLMSIYEGFKNRARFDIRKRLPFYIFGSIVSLLITTSLYLTTSERNIGLLTSICIFLFLILSNISYYVRGERNHNLLQNKFRLMKYMFVGFFIMIILAIAKQF